MPIRQLTMLNLTVDPDAPDYRVQVDAYPDGTVEIRDAFNGNPLPHEAARVVWALMQTIGEEI